MAGCLPTYLGRQVVVGGETAADNVPVLRSLTTSENVHSLELMSIHPLNHYPSPTSDHHDVQQGNQYSFLTKTQNAKHEICSPYPQAPRLDAQRALPARDGMNESFNRKGAAATATPVKIRRVFLTPGTSMCRSE